MNCSKAFDWTFFPGLYACWAVLWCAVLCFSQWLLPAAMFTALLSFACSHFKIKAQCLSCPLVQTHSKELHLVLDTVVRHQALQLECGLVVKQLSQVIT